MARRFFVLHVVFTKFHFLCAELLYASVVLFCALLSLAGARQSFQDSTESWPNAAWGAGILAHPNFGDKIACVSPNNLNARLF